MSVTLVFAWALFGGAFSELLHWASLKKNTKRFPIYFHSAIYWVITVLMIAAGAVFAVAVDLSGTTLTPLTAIVLGYSAPSLVQRVAKAVPTPSLGTSSDSDTKPSVHAFLIG